MGLPPTKPTIEDYYALIDAGDTKAEWVNGEIYVMSGGTAAHAAVPMSLGRVLGNRLLGRPCAVFSSDLMVLVEETDLHAFPDLTVVCGPLKRSARRKNLIINPTLLVEVLSPSSESYDRDVKFQHYRRIPSLQEYVIVRADRPHIEVYRRVADGWLFQEFSGLEASCPLPSLGVDLPLSEVFAVLSMPGLLDEGVQG